MSWLFSQALVAEYSAATCSAGEPSAQLNVMPTPHKFWCNDRTMEPSDLSRFGLTCAVLTADRGAELLTSFRAGFRVRTFRSPAMAPDSQGKGRDSGENLRGSFAKWDQNSFSWKTAQLSLLEDSATFSETWPRSGMTRNGRACLRPTAARPIYANASGFWQTPVADDSVERTSGKWNSRGEPKLSAEAKLWPTPVASDTGQRKAKYAQVGTALSLAVTLWPTPTVCGNYNRKGASSTSGDGLATAVKTWPTPCASASKGSSLASLTRKSGRSRTNDRIDHAVMHSDGGQLNPEWVEWLMGWPIGHTGLEPLVTGRLVEWQQQHSLNSHPDLSEAA